MVGGGDQRYVGTQYLVLGNKTRGLITMTHHVATKLEDSGLGALVSLSSVFSRLRAAFRMSADICADICADMCADMCAGAIMI